MGDNGDSKALVYLTVGALAAVGVGYLVWRYGMSDESKERTMQALKGARRKAGQAVKAATAGAKETLADASGQARDGVAQVRATAARKATELGQRLRET
jgi:hypothetical protein